MTFLLFVFSLLATQPDSNLFFIAKQKQSEYNIIKKDYVVIIDYSKPMSENRLFLLDMKKEKVILETHVSHAIFSGNMFATDFSNEINSRKSSLGAYITAETKYGHWGYSLVVDGLDKGINHNARKRNILFHSTKLMSNQKFPRTYGCFATSDEINKKLIDLIKGGCLVYVHK